MTPVFLLLCALGAVAAVGLAVREARAQDPVRAQVSTTRTGLTTNVTVVLTNRTAAARCVLVRVVARDRAGHDLAAADAGRHELAPHATARSSAALVLTSRQYDEQLTLTRAVLRSCP
jgi:hypothetical protein